MLSFATLVGLCSILIALLGIQAAPSSGVEVFEHLRGIPEGWVQGGAPPASKLIRLRIAVRQEEKSDLFEQRVIDISTPNHPLYGQHMKRDELKAFLKPSPEVSGAILSWLDAEGISEDFIENDGDWINFIAPVSRVERMLNTHFYYFYHKEGNARQIRTLQYSLPQKLHQYVQMIQPTTRFGQMRPNFNSVVSATPVGNPPVYGSATQINATYCNTTVSPDCLRALYGLGNFRANPHVGNKLGISGYLEEYAQYADLALFESKYAPYTKNASFDVQSIDGGLNTQGDPADSIEANLDMQFGLSLSYKTPVTFYTTSGRGILVPDLDQPDPSNNENEPYLDQLHYLISLPDKDLPTVLSTSYGEDEQSIPASYTKSACNLFAKLGARGVSVIFSSGDTGPGSACQTNDGKNTSRLLPIFPAACPFVTSVGGTHNVEPEVAIHFSSGGFSDRFPRPSYQDEAVEEYLSILGDTFKGLFNRHGRGFPDVATQAYNYTVFDKGQEIRVGGTRQVHPLAPRLAS